MRFNCVFGLSIVLIGSPAYSQSAKPVDQGTLNYLNSLQNADGGYAPAGGRPGTPVRSSLRATTSALRAIKYLGGTPRELPSTLTFVEKCFDKTTGGFGDAPGETPTPTISAIGAMAAVDLKLPPEKYRDAAIRYLEEHTKTTEEVRIVAAAFESLQQRPAKADEWLRQIAATRNADGSFGAGGELARATGGTAAMILRLGGKLDRDAVLKVIRGGQRTDGGFGSSERDGSDLESTYRIMRAFAMLKELPSDPGKLRSFIAKCRSATGGYGVMPGQPPSASGTYFAAIILHWLNESQR